MSRHCVLAMTHLQIVEEIDRAVARAGGINTCQLQCDGDIVGRVQEWQQIMRLENESNLFETQSAQVVAQPVAIPRDQFAVDFHRPRRRTENAANDVEQRRLAGTGRAKERNELSGVDGERYVLKGVNPGFSFAEVFGDMIDPYERSIPI